jgi:hypothetical protein
VIITFEVRPRSGTPDVVASAQNLSRRLCGQRRERFFASDAARRRISRISADTGTTSEILSIISIGEV